MHLPDDQGRTRISQLRLFAQRTGRELPELQPPDLPSELEYLWAWFLDLHRARSSGAAGPDPIGFADLQAWASLTARDVRPWEIAALREIDARCLRLINEHRAAAAAPKAPKHDRHRQPRR